MNDLLEVKGQQNVVQGAFKRNILVRYFGKLRSWNQRRQAIRELESMPDSLLNDLGIQRYQIVDVVNNTGAFARLQPAQVSNADAAPVHKAAA